ncbi:MAG: transposase [Lachnospiraceae bacterium]|nr:transposase [Lachnospiraceae bacterium]
MQYHIVWCVKYKHKMITADIEKCLIGIVKSDIRNPL